MSILVYTFLWIWTIICRPIQKADIKIKNIRLNGRMVYIFCVFLIMLLIMALRSTNVGADTFNYAMNIYPSMTQEHDAYAIYDDNLYTGRIYWMFFYFISFISNSPQMYILVESIIISLGMGIFIYRSSEDVGISSMVFLCSMYMQSLSLARQYVGVVLALNAFLFIFKNKKSVIGWGLYMVSVGIHASMLVFLIAIAGIWIMDKQRGRNKYLVLIGMFVLFMFKNLEIFLNFIIPLTVPQYADYLNGSSSIYNLLIADEDVGIGVLLLHLCFCFILYVYIAKAQKENDGFRKVTYAMIPGALVSGIAGCVFYDSFLISRVFLPMDCLYILIIPAVYKRLRGKMKILFYAFVLLVVSMGYMRQVFLHDFIYEFFY